MQSLGENMTGCRAENTRSFPTDKNFQESPHLSALCLYPPDNVLLWKAVLFHYRLFITFMLCCCL